ELELTLAEKTAPTLEERFARRTIQRLDLYALPADDSGTATERARPDREHETAQLALIDKASPHALFDLMLTEVSPPAAGSPVSADPGTVAAETARLLWQTAANFHRFVSTPAIRQAFGLTNGTLHLALNCDPFTQDRESVQALKRFHLHLIYWRASELAPLRKPHRFGDQTDRYLARQCIDPLSFIGMRLLGEGLHAMDAMLDSAWPSPANRTRVDDGLDAADGKLGDDAFGIAARALGGDWLHPDANATCSGQLPLGALLRLPSWEQLAHPAFEQLIHRLHGRIGHIAQALQSAMTGSELPPARWHRHRLLPLPQIAANLEALELSAASKADLLQLASTLRNLSERSMQRLERATPSQRQHCMTLNQPCYSLTLAPFPLTPFPLAPARSDGGRSEMAGETPPLLSIQPKLFSGIGGAGLLSLPGVPSVRVVRGQGRFSAQDWQRRARFQRAFARYNSAALSTAADHHSGLRTGPIRRLRDRGTGWTD
ncbi:MAG: hypothetical protein GVY22_11675, partial [Gammaproteobacteria bacterium]|nr:hypothetical protein [Gammaproteobacteria bacterium]